MKKLSVIIPYCNEYPQIVFTVQNVIEELKGIDAEIITVDNYVEGKGTSAPEDQGYEKLSTNSYYKRSGLLKNIKWSRGLSHWNAKNAGASISEGERLLFLDAHCIIEKNSIANMLKSECQGTLHMQICYMLDPHKLIYSARPEEMHYTFCSAPSDKEEPYEVPVMSTCGMMMEKKTFNTVKGWNPELGIYGGGENYMMYKLAVCGYPIKIHPGATLYHYAEKRGYSWNYDDYVRNQFIAAYCVGGEEWLTKLLNRRKDKKNSNEKRLNEIADDVRQKCEGDRQYIQSIKRVDLGEYFRRFGYEANQDENKEN